MFINYLTSLLSFKKNIPKSCFLKSSVAIQDLCDLVLAQTVTILLFKLTMYNIIRTCHGNCMIINLRDTCKWLNSRIISYRIGFNRYIGISQQLFITKISSSCPSNSHWRITNINTTGQSCCTCSYRHIQPWLHTSSDCTCALWQ